MLPESQAAKSSISISAHGGCAELDAKTWEIEGFPPTVQPYKAETELPSWGSKILAPAPLNYS